MADLAHAAPDDTDLFGDIDASHWAQRFASKFPALLQDGKGVIIDIEDLMTTWFAGAIETGRAAKEETCGRPA